MSLVEQKNLSGRSSIYRFLCGSLSQILAVTLDDCMVFPSMFIKVSVSPNVLY